MGQTQIQVTLDGSGSSDPEESSLNCTWTGVPDPADVVQPTVLLAAGVYTFTLVVTDEAGAQSAPDTVIITVNPPANQVPVAEAGSDQQHTVLPGQTIDVTLNAANSSDTDGDAIDTYTWTGTPDPQDVAEPGVTLEAGIHIFTLVVADSRGGV